MNPEQSEKKLSRHLSFLAQDENNINLLLEVSNLYTELNDLDSAQLYLTKANQIDREACLAHQGLLYLNQGKVNDALLCFQEAINSFDNPSLRYNLGFTYYLNNELSLAKEYLSSITDEEYKAPAQLLLARILHHEQGIEQAIELLEQLLEHNPNNPEVLGFLSLLYFDVNEEALAKELSQRALSINADIYDAKLVDVMLRLLIQETSVEEIKELLEINPKDSRLSFALGSTYMSQGEFVKAQEYLQNTLNIHPEFYDCYIALAWCQLLNNQASEAHETYQNAITLIDSLAEGWGGLALIHALNNDLENAQKLIDRALSLSSDCFLTKMAQVVFLNYSNPEQASKDFLQMITNQQTPLSQKLALIIEYLDAEIDMETAIH